MAPDVLRRDHHALAVSEGRCVYAPGGAVELLRLKEQLHHMTDGLRTEHWLLSVEGDIGTRKQINCGHAAGAARCSPPGLRLFHRMIEPHIHIVAVLAQAHVDHLLHRCDHSFIV